MSHMGELAYLHSSRYHLRRAVPGAEHRLRPWRCADVIRREPPLPHLHGVGHARGTRPSPHLTHSSSTAAPVCSTWCATYHDGNQVFETYWTKRRGAEVLDYSYTLMDLTVFGGRRNGRAPPAGWPRQAHDPDPGRGSGVAAPVGVARRSSRLAMADGSKPGTRTIWARRTRVQRSLRIIATDGSCRRRTRPHAGPGAVFQFHSHGSGAGRRRLPNRPSSSKASRRMRTMLGRACCPPPTTIGLRRR